MIQNGPAATGAQRLGWKINARADGAEILIYEEIGYVDWFTEEGTTAKGFRDDLAAIPAGSALTVRINSPGGEVFDGVAIHSALMNSQAHVTVLLPVPAEPVRNALPPAFSRETAAD